MLDEKERLSDKEYESIGRLLLELIAECPYVPDAVAQEPGGILYQSIGTKASIGICKRKFYGADRFSGGIQKLS